MKIFLVQHGLAVTKPEDPLRPLSAEGVASAEAMSQWAQDVGVSVSAIRHSGKLRAEQTAQYFADNLKPSGGISIASGLAPNDDVHTMVKIVNTELVNSMIVGHLPFLSRFASLLVAGDSEIEVVRFCNSGIVCLVNDNNSWSIDWVMTPDQLT